MISYRIVKMTSNYPTSYLEVRRNQKVNKLIFKGQTSVSTSILITLYSLVAHVCRQKIVLQAIMLLLSDMPFIKHEACTKVNLHCTMPLFPITKMVELSFLSHYHVCNIMCIKTIGMTKIAKQSCV